MRVVFLSWKDVAHPLSGGSETLIDRVAHGLHERGHEVTVFCGGPVGEHDYRVVDAGGRLAQYAADPLLVRRHAGDHDVVVDVCNGLPFFSPLWSTKPVVALVNHIHFGMWREWFSPATAWVGSTIETKLMPRVYANRRVIAVSDSTARALCSLGMERERISVVHNGVDLRAETEREAFRRTPDPTFCAIGRLVPHKRFDLMLRAWKEVREDLGSGTLYVAGDGPLREQLEAAAPEGTVFLGRISEEDKTAMLDESWALIQPSRLEGWGIVVMEAAACGTPTLGFWVPGTRDAVVHQESGLLVRSERELIDAWTGFARDAEQRRVLSKGANARAEDFSWERTVTEFETVLETAIDEDSTRRSATGGEEDRPLPLRRRDVAAAGIRERVELFRLFRREKEDPDPFYRSLARRSIDDLPYQLDGRRVLDLGCGSGHFTDVLREHGADVVPVELDAEALAQRGEPPQGSIQTDATLLPFADESFDGVYCSNMLEHTPSVTPVFEEIRRVLRPGGWAWVSWTNWYSPWGGHEIVPFHYLGPNAGLAAWTRLHGAPRKNVPFDGLWPTHIGAVLRELEDHDELEVRGVFPRYWPSQRWITRIPGIREVLTWNCVLLIERADDWPEPDLGLDTTSPRARGRRVLRRIRRTLGDDPRFLPIVLRATPLGLSRAVGPETDLVVEGFPRSGNTFAHFALALVEPAATVVSRVHTPSQVKQAVRRGTPVLFVIREPIAAIASMTTAAPHVPLRSSLLEYIHHHEQVLPLAEQMVIATFDEVTGDFGQVVDAINDRFGLGFRRFEHTPEQVETVFRAIESHHQDTWGDDEAGLPKPAGERRRHTDRIRRELQRPEFESLVAEAQSVHDALAAHSISRR